MEAHAITWYNIEYDWKTEFKELFHHCIEINGIPCNNICFNGIYFLTIENSVELPAMILTPVEANVSPKESHGTTLNMIG